MTVTLGLAIGLARASFTTRNQLEPGRAMTMRLVDGPFDHLEGRWEFTPIARCRARARTCMLHSRPTASIGAIVLGPAFEGVCNQLVDAFGRRARQVYGGS